MLYAVINTATCEVVDVYDFYPSVLPSSDCDVVSFPDDTCFELPEFLPGQDG